VHIAFQPKLGMSNSS